MADTSQFYFEDSVVVDVPEIGGNISVLRDIPFGSAAVLDDARGKLQAAQHAGAAFTSEMAGAMADFVTTLVVDWTITRKDGTKVEVTRANFLKLGAKAAEAIATAAGTVFTQGRAQAST